MQYLGIDMGGTKTSVCIGTDTGRILRSERIPTKPEDGPENSVARIVALCRRMLGRAGAVCAGLAAPGPVDVRKGLIVSAPNLPGWREVPVVSMFEQALGMRVRMNNDANACALAEYRFGAERGAANLVYITHSTGIGGGLIVDGRLVQGVTDTAGEVGHFVLDPAGPSCPCGLRGCFEAYCGGRSVALRLREDIKRRTPKTDMVRRAGGDIDRIDFKVFLNSARAGDAYALRWWDEYVTRMAQGLGTLIMTLNPEAIVLGTIAIHAGNFLLDPLRERLGRFCWQIPARACRVSASALGSKIGDYSALALAIGGHSRIR